MDTISIDIVNGEKHKIVERNYDKLYTFLIAQLSLMLFFYGEFYLITKLKKPKEVWKFLLRSIGLILTVLVFCIILLKATVFPNDENIEGFDGVVFMTIFYLSIVFCYGFTKKWLKHEQDTRQLELIKNQAELSLLRQQLQPHFLFNTMNNLLSMVNQSDNPKLAHSIDRLSDLLRYVVYNTKNEKVAIVEEINFIKNFSELQG